MVCQSCSQPMSAESAVCPHCGARSAKVDSDQPLSAEEVRALLAFEKASTPAAPPNLFVQLLLPHVAMSGAGLGADVVLTLLGLPAIIGALVMLVFARRFLARLEASRGGELGFALLVGVFGGTVVWSVLPLVTSMSSGTALIVALVSLFALIGRALVRMAATPRSDLLD